MVKPTEPYRHRFIDREWFVNGFRHRIDGPALIESGLKEYYLHGDMLSLTALNGTRFKYFLEGLVVNRRIGKIFDVKTNRNNVINENNIIKMGYSYKITLRAKEQDEWKDVDSYSNSGSFSCEEQHYFLTHTGNHNFCHKNESGYSTYIFPASVVLSEYFSYQEQTWKDIMKETIDSCKTPEEAMEAIQKFDCDYFRRPTFWTELETWSLKIRKLNKDVEDVRIIYEIAV